MAVAIVTGAGSGIGRAVAGELSRCGHRLVLAGRTSGKLEAVAADLRAKGGEALVVPTDVAQPVLVERLMSVAMDAFGRIDILINNAGYAPLLPVHEMTPEQWRRILDTNLSSVFYATRAVWPIMRGQHDKLLAGGMGTGPSQKATGGVIVNISSEAARDPFPGLGGYAAAKVGVNMLTYVTAREGDGVGIRVYGVAPAAVETGMFRALPGMDKVPGEKILRPEDVAEAVGGCVEGAMRYASGETIYIHRHVM